MGTICGNSKKPKIVDSKIFFNIDQSQVNSNPNTPNYKTPVKLEFTLDNCESHHKYQIQAKMNNKNEAFNTEVATIKQKGITFNTCYICDYYFERQQYLNIILLKDSKPDKNIKVILGIVVGSPNSTYKTPIGSKGENIIISAQSLKDTDSFIGFDFIVKTNNNMNFSHINN